MTPITSNTPAHAQPLNFDASEVPTQSYLGGVIRAIRSCSAYMIPSTQRPEHTLSVNEEGVRVQAPDRRSFLAAIQYYTRDFVCSPEHYMSVTAAPENIERDRIQSETSAFFSYLNDGNQLLSVVTFWNFLCSLNPHYIAPLNADLTPVNEQAAPQNSFSIGHFVGLICSQVSSRSMLPQEMHWLLDNTSNYVMVCSNIKMIQDLYAIFKAKYNALPLVENEADAVPVNNPGHQDEGLNEEVVPLNDAFEVPSEDKEINHENQSSIILNKTKYIGKIIEKHSSFILKCHSLLYDSPMIRQKEIFGKELFNLAKLLLSLSVKSESIKTKHMEPLTEDNAAQNTHIPKEPETKLYLKEELAELVAIEKTLDEITIWLMNLNDAIVLTLNELMLFMADDFIPDAVSHQDDINFYADMPEFED